MISHRGSEHSTNPARIRTLSAVLLALLLPSAAPAQFTYEVNNNAVTITGYDCMQFQVTIPPTIGGLPVTSIAGGAFSNCPSLIIATIAANVENIGPRAFSGCRNLTSVTIGNEGTAGPNTLSIHENAFENCSNLVNVALGKNVTLIGASAFANTGLTNIVAPENVKSIEAGAFANCASLLTADIGTGVTNIGEAAFSYCSGLTSIKLGTGITSIAPYTFFICSSLLNIAIPSTVTIIGPYSFSGCSNLETAELSSGLTEIGEGAFQSCSKLTIQTVPDTVAKIGAFTFSGCDSLTSISLPASVTNIGEDAFSYCGHLSEITVAPLNPAYSSVDGALLDKAQTILMKVPQTKTGTYRIPETVRHLGTHAFAACLGLADVIMPKGLLTIGHGAFDSTRLTTLEIPETVTTIGPVAFYQCNAFTSLVIPKSVASIGNGAFSYCINLRGIYFLGTPPTVELLSFYGFPTVYHLPGPAWEPNLGGLTTAPWVLPYPVVTDIVSASDLRTSPFAFIISWATNTSVVVEASTGLATSAWAPIQTNAIANGWIYFADVNWTNYPARFYRVRGL